MLDTKDSKRIGNFESWSPTLVTVFADFLARQHEMSQNGTQKCLVLQGLHPVLTRLSPLNQTERQISLSVIAFF